MVLDGPIAKPMDCPVLTIRLRAVYCPALPRRLEARYHGQITGMRKAAASLQRSEQRR